MFINKLHNAVSNNTQVQCCSGTKKASPLAQLSKDTVSFGNVPRYSCPPTKGQTPPLQLKLVQEIAEGGKAVAEAIGKKIEAIWSKPTISPEEQHYVTSARSALAVTRRNGYHSV
jgi:hypothetical protein